MFGDFAKKSLLLSISAGLLLTACGGGGGSSGTGLPEAGLILASVTPVDGASEIPLDSQITAHFGFPLNPASVTTASFTLFHGSNQIPAIVVATDYTATLIPASPLVSNRIYKATLSSQITGTDGKILGADYVWSFATVDQEPLAISAVWPLPGIKKVPVDITMHADFSKDVKPATINNETFTLKVDEANGATIQGNVTYSPSERRAFFTLPTGTTLEILKKYKATISKDVEDLKGNTLGTDFSWTFTTEDPNAPKVLSTFPENGADSAEIVADPNTGAPLQIKVEFSKTMDSGSINDMTFLVRDMTRNIPITGSIVYQHPFAIFTPTGAYSTLELDTQYQVTLITPNGIFDLVPTDLVSNQDNGMNYIFSFHTKKGLGSPVILDSKPEDANSPQITYDSIRDRFNAVWRQKANPGATDYAIFANSFKDYPDPSTRLIINAQTGDATAPQMAADGFGNSYAVWAERSVPGGPYSIYLSRNLGQGWGAPESVENFPGDAINPQIAVSSFGQIYLVWQQILPAQNIYSVVYNEDLTGQGAWLASPFYPLEIDMTPNYQYQANIGEATEPRIAIDLGGNVAVSFLQKNLNYGTNANPQYDPGNSILVTESIQAGGLGGNMITFENEALASNSITEHAIVYDPQSNVGLVYSQKIGNAANRSLIFWSHPAGAAPNAWNGVIIESGTGNPAYDSQNPNLIIDSSGQYLLTYKRRTSNPNANYSILARVRSAAGAWGAISYLDNDGPLSTSNAQNPKGFAVPGSGGFYVLFEQKTPEQPAVWSLFMNKRDATGVWQYSSAQVPPPMIENGDTNATNGQLTLDVQGNVKFVYQQALTGEAVNSILLNAWKY